MTVVHKTLARAAGSNPREFVMSDATVDRMGDVIEPTGWKLDNFLRNPIALFAHDSNLPVGNWKNVRVQGGQLIGEIDFLPVGKSPRVDEIAAFVDAKMLRAVSVGFRPINAEPMKNGGIRFKSVELVECSVVSVPANPNALQIAKQLHLSDDAQRMIFGEHADGINAVERSGSPGEPASQPPKRKIQTMKTLADRIVDAQNEVVRQKDALTAHLADENFDETVSDEIAKSLGEAESKLASLQRAENALATKSVGAGVVTGAAGTGTVERAGDARRPFAMPSKKSAASDVIVRSAVVQLLSHIERRSLQDVLIGRYGEDDSIKAMLDVTTKAATVPATTTAVGWAAELVQTATLDLIEQLVGKSIYPILRDIGGKFSFGRNGVVSLPARSSGTSVAGSFVGQGAPIPVRQAAFSATALTPKKMAVITTFTREIAEKSTPDIEQVLRQAIQEDTGVAIDTILMDAGAATVIRPAGLRNGVVAATPTAGGGFAALVADLKALVAALIGSSNGNIRQPVWILNPVQVLSISLTQNSGGDFPFAADLRAGTLLGYPVAASATVPLGTVALVDAADFFTATGDEPRFDVSDQATLHMEDTTPLAISAAGTPNVVAAPVRSMFQTDSIALRMILDMNWAMRRAGMVAVVTGVTW